MMKMMKSIPLAALALTLGACGGNKDAGEEVPAAETNIANFEAETVNTTEVLTEAPPATRIDNASTESEPAQATLTPDEQTQDYADATGMTARVARDEGGNDTAP